MARFVALDRFEASPKRIAEYRAARMANYSREHK